MKKPRFKREILRVLREESPLTKYELYRRVCERVGAKVSMTPFWKELRRLEAEGEVKVLKRGRMHLVFPKESDPEKVMDFAKLAAAAGLALREWERRRFEKLFDAYAEYWRTPKLAALQQLVEVRNLARKILTSSRANSSRNSRNKLIF